MPNNRNISFSYALELPGQYQLDRVLGRIRTTAISSDTVIFEADRNLPLAQKIRLVLRWPATLPNGTPLNLWIEGEITRSAMREACVRVSSYEFRTRPRLPAHTSAYKGVPADPAAPVSA